LRFWEHLGWYHVKYDYRTLQIPQLLTWYLRFLAVSCHFS
jgi:hypothetical protein